MYKNVHVAVIAHWRLGSRLTQLADAMSTMLAHIAWRSCASGLAFSLLARSVISAADSSSSSPPGFGVCGGSGHSASLLHLLWPPASRRHRVQLNADLLLGKFVVQHITCFSEPHSAFSEQRWMVRQIHQLAMLFILAGTKHARWHDKPHADFHYLMHDCKGEAHSSSHPPRAYHERKQR